MLSPSRPIAIAHQEKQAGVPFQMCGDFTRISRSFSTIRSLPPGTHFLATTHKGNPASYFYPLAFAIGPARVAGRFRSKGPGPSTKIARLNVQRILLE